MTIKYITICSNGYYTYVVGTQTQTYVVVPQHGPLSLHIKFEGPSITNLNLFFPLYGPWMIF